MGFRNFPKFTVDVAANDSDKTITVPSGESWELLGVYVTLTTTGNAGNRQIEIQIATSDGILVRLEFGENQAASITDKRYAAAPNMVTELHITGEMIFAQLPRLHLRSGDTIRVFDNAGIDASADDMEVQVNHISHSNL